MKRIKPSCDNICSIPSISVVIPVNNRPNELRRALASVRQQSVEPVDVVVVDDASEPRLDPDDFADLGEMTLIRSDVQLGPSGARNAGILACHTDWIAFLDSDDAWMAHHLEDISSAVARAAGEAGAVLTGFRVTTRSGRRRKVLPSVAGQEQQVRFLRLESQPVTASAIAVNASLLAHLGRGFDPDLTALEDWELLATLAGSAPILEVRKVSVDKLRSLTGERAYNPQRDLDATRRLLQRLSPELSSDPVAARRMRIRVALRESNSPSIAPVRSTPGATRTHRVLGRLYLSGVRRYGSLRAHAVRGVGRIDSLRARR